MLYLSTAPLRYDKEINIILTGQLELRYWVPHWLLHFATTLSSFNLQIPLKILTVKSHCLTHTQKIICLFVCFSIAKFEKSRSHSTCSILFYDCMIAFHFSFSFHFILLYLIIFVKNNYFPSKNLCSKYLKKKNNQKQKTKQNQKTKTQTQNVRSNVNLYTNSKAYNSNNTKLKSSLLK